MKSQKALSLTIFSFMKCIYDFLNSLQTCVRKRSLPKLARTAVSFLSTQSHIRYVNTKYFLNLK